MILQDICQMYAFLSLFYISRNNVYVCVSLDSDLLSRLEVFSPNLSSEDIFR